MLIRSRLSAPNQPMVMLMSDSTKNVALAVATMAILAVRPWRSATRLRILSFQKKTSIRARMAMLNMLLPKRLPASRSGAPAEIELMPVRSSGSDVAAEMSMVPTKRPPRPVRTPMASP